MDRALIFERLMENTREGYWLIDPDGLTLDLNPAMCKILDRPRDAVLGRSIYDFVDEANRAVFLAQLEKRRRGIVGPYEIELLRGDGTNIPCVNNATPILDDDGNRLGSVGLWTDISEIKAVQENLRLAKEEAEAANKAKSQFLASMSHEIRTPLNGVLGMAELLLGAKLGANERYLAETIQRSGRAVMDTINDLLDFSKIEAGRIELEPIAFDCAQMIEDVAETVAHAGHVKGLEIGIDIDRRFPKSVTADPIRLRQVLLNLASNAVKFTESGSVLIEATYDETVRALRLSVVDTGIGIPHEAKTRIFDPFIQQDRSTTRRFGGTGLGLSISNQLVQLMGGTLKLSSKEGVGTRFEVVLPLKLQGDFGPEDARTQPDIYVFAPSPTTLRTLETQFQRIGQSPRTFVKSAELLEALQCASCEVRYVFFDMSARESEVFELIHHLQQLESPHDVRAVGLHPLGLVEPRLVLAELGVQHMISTPVRLQSLKQLFEGGGDTGDAAQDVPLADLSDGMPVPVVRPKSEGGASVLVVEDNMVNQIVVCEMLEQLGFETTVAHNGAEGVELAKSGKFSVILMDCHMPVMDGYSATRTLRATAGEVRETPIIALTANALTGDRDACLAAGMNDFITKPIGLNQLAATIDRWTRV